ncbi:MAG: family 1 glycosylhydrolase [Lachnospiraceae bacterium]
MERPQVDRFFLRYCETVFRRYNRKVNYWLTFNKLNNTRRMKTSVDSDTVVFVIFCGKNKSMKMYLNVIY